MSFPCPHCGGEIVVLAEKAEKSEPPWRFVDAEDREAQQAFRRQPVVYAFFAEDGKLLYIGKAREPTWRWQQHRRMKSWWGSVSRIGVLVASDAHSAYVLEQRLIRHLQPAFNIQGRW